MCKRRMITTELLELVLATVMIAAFQGRAEARDPGPTAGTYDGPSRNLGGGRAHTFVTLDAGGRPTALGIRMSEAALSGLPAEPPRDADGWEYVLSLPKEAAISGYDHIGIDWNPTEPNGNT